MCEKNKPLYILTVTCAACCTAYIFFSSKSVIFF